MSEKRYMVLFGGYPQGRFELHEDAVKCAESFFVGTLSTMNKEPVEICYIVNTFTKEGEMKSFHK